MNFFRTRKPASKSKPAKCSVKSILEGPLYVSLDNKPWKYRLCKLYPDKLIVYKSAKNKKKVLLCWKLDVDQFVQIVVLQKQLRGKPHAFSLSDFSVKHLFSGDSPQHTDFWYHTVGGAIKKLQTVKNWWDANPMDSFVGAVVEKKYEETISSFLLARGENPEDDVNETGYEAMAAIAQIAVNEAEKKVKQARMRSRRLIREEINFLQEEKQKIRIRSSMMKSVRAVPLGSFHSIKSDTELSAMMKDYKDSEKQADDELEASMEELRNEMDNNENFDSVDDVKNNLFLSNEQDRSLLALKKKSSVRQGSAGTAPTPLNPYLQKRSVSNLEVEGCPSSGEIVQDEKVIDSLLLLAEDELEVIKAEEKKYEEELELAKRVSSVMEQKRQKEAVALIRASKRVPSVKNRNTFRVNSVLQEVAVPKTPKASRRKKDAHKYTSMVIEFESMDQILQEEASKMREEKDHEEPPLQIPVLKNKSERKSLKAQLESLPKAASPSPPEHEMEDSDGEGDDEGASVISNPPVQIELPSPALPSVEGMRMSFSIVRSRNKGRSAEVPAPTKPDITIVEKEVEPAEKAVPEPAPCQASEADVLKVKEALKLWQDKIDKYRKEKVANDVSGLYGSTFKKFTFRGRPKTKAGKPTPTTAAMNKETEAYIEREVNLLKEKIIEIGSVEAETGHYIVSFGALFVSYSKISDTLVGILMRAKKRGLVTYRGTMLFKGVHDSVQITLFNNSNETSSEI